MPFGNGTGPAGLGPMTGRAAGYCAGYNVPGYMNSIPGRGYIGRGLGGGGWGRRNWFYATGLTGWQRTALGYPAPRAYPYAITGQYPLAGEQELELLKSQASYYENTLGNIRKRIEELEKQSREPVEKKK